MAKQVNRKELIHLQSIKDNRCIDMLLTMDEIEKAVLRAEDPKNNNLISSTCDTCWPIEKPPECTFWNRIMFKCPK